MPRCYGMQRILPAVLLLLLTSCSSGDVPVTAVVQTCPVAKNYSVGEKTELKAELAQVTPGNFPALNQLVIDYSVLVRESRDCGKGGR